MLFDSIFQGLICILVAVEAFDDAEEFEQLVSLIEVCVQVLMFLKNLDEDTHDVGENGDSKQEDHSAQ